MPTVITNHDNVDWGTNIVLQSNDQPKPTEYVVSRDAAKMSGLIKDLLEDAPDGQPVIPVPNVTGRTLYHVLCYMEQHFNNRALPIEKPLRTKIEDVISEWDRAFIFNDLVKNHDEKQHETLIDVIMAANFLNVKDLLDLTCATVASMIKGKTPDQIRALFNIDNDFSPEEEQKIMEENHWCEDV